jgi:ribosomal protein L21E
MARWVLALQEYEPFVVEYRRGTTNANADALSRLPLDYERITTHRVNTLDIDMEQKYDEKEGKPPEPERLIPAEQDVSTLQQQDKQWAQLYQCVKNPNGVWDTKLRAASEQYVIHDNILYRRYLANGKPQTTNLILQLCLPRVMVRGILREMHDEPYSGHLGIDKTWARIFNRYYWEKMQQDIAHYCTSCEVCARRKVPKRMDGIPTLSPQLNWIELYGAMECIAIDEIGPITTSNRSSSILTIVDLYTRYGCAVPLLRQTTKNIVQALVQKWFVIHGMPKVILCDNGPSFAANDMRACMEAMGIKVKYILPYHPESNGICERLNGTVINMVSSYIQDERKQDKWSQYLDHVLFAYNTSTHSATGYTPFYLVHAREACIGSETILNSHPRDFYPYPTYMREVQRDMWLAHRHITERVIQRAEAREQLNEKLKSLATYQKGDQVWIYKLPKSLKGISAKLVSPFVGPYTVINQFNDVSYHVKRNNSNKKIIVHVSRMKRYIQRDADLQAATDEADAEAARDALPSSSNVGDDIENTVSGATRARIRSRAHARSRTQRVPWGEPEAPEHKARGKKSPHHEATSPSSSPVIDDNNSNDNNNDNNNDTDLEEGEVRRL